MDTDEKITLSRFDALVGRHGAMVERICLRRAEGDVARCSDLRQECLLALWQRLPTLRKGSTEREERNWVAWTFKSVFSHLARRKRVLALLPIDQRLADTLVAEDERELQEVMDDLTSLLTEREQEAFRLMAEGCDASELAEEMGIKHCSVVLLRHRIIKKLREYVVKERSL